MTMHGEHESRKGDGSHITREQVARIEDYVRELLRRMEIPFWRVYVATDLPPDDALLMIEPTDGRRIAMLYVHERWWESRDSEEKRSDLTHEVLHLLHHDAESVIREFKNNNGDVGQYPLSIVWGQFALELERMTDALSYVVSEWMPTWVEPEATASEPEYTI